MRSRGRKSDAGLSGSPKSQYYPEIVSEHSESYGVIPPISLFEKETLYYQFEFSRISGSGPCFLKSRLAIRRQPPVSRVCHPGPKHLRFPKRGRKSIVTDNVLEIVFCWGQYILRLRKTQKYEVLKNIKITDFKNYFKENYRKF